MILTLPSVNGSLIDATRKDLNNPNNPNNPNEEPMDEFTQAYVECALWSTTIESDPSGGDPLDDNYGVEDIDPATLARMVADCRRFQEENADDISTWEGSQYTSEEMAGHDFWLTRNGHGCGFWDGDWPEDSGDRLDKASEAFGEVCLYVGGDGKIYL